MQSLLYADSGSCCRITPALQCEQLASCRAYALHVKGTAFLWHQVSFTPFLPGLEQHISGCKLRPSDECVDCREKQLVWACVQQLGMHSGGWPLQVRCMAAVLLMVGRGLEQPSVVQRMLDIETTRQKPQYNMAAEVWLFSPESGTALCMVHAPKSATPSYVRSSVERYERKHRPSYVIISQCEMTFVLCAGAAALLQMRL